MKKNQFDDFLKQVLKKPMKGIDLKTGKPIRIATFYHDGIVDFIKRRTDENYRNGK